MNAVFTIVAKNYLSQARTLGDSIKKANPEVDFFILLADEAEEYLDLKKESYQVIEAKDIGIDNFEEMAFKYNVLEFCTAVKPFFIEYLIKTNKYSKIIYFDPDIYVYNKLDVIFDELDKYFMILTPHYLNMEEKYSGAFSDEELLFVGIFNLGFVAFRNCEETNKVVRWWKNRLRDNCYADRNDALHVDQKWMDFIPAFFGKEVLISKDAGYNAAIWNIQEKDLIEVDNKLYMQNNFGDRKAYPLTFFHFSGFNPNDPNEMCRKQKKYNLENKPEYKDLFMNYANELIKNGYNELNKYPYTYSKFKNGVIINQLYRRIYRIAIESDIKSGTDAYMQETIVRMREYLHKNNYNINQPFNVGDNTFYAYLEKNKIIIQNGDELYNLNKRTYSDLNKKIKFAVSALKICRKLLGTKRYYLLLTFMERYTRLEYQVFLLNNVVNK